MGFSIEEVSGNGVGGPTNYTFTADLTNPAVTSVSGDFDAFRLGFINTGEATDGYSFSAVSNTSYGDLSATSTTAGTFTFLIDRAAVFASGSDQIVSFTITGTEGGTTDTNTIFVEMLICVTQGTLIRTPDGLRPVEEIQPGDLVWTADNGPRPVRWIGHRHLTPQDLIEHDWLHPISFAPGALGPDVPARRMRVSPQHRILVKDWRAELMFDTPEVLIPAKALVNGKGVTQDSSGDALTYYHLLFDDHEVIETDGALTESFHPSGYALSELADAAKVELAWLFPGLFEQGYGNTARRVLRPWEAQVLPGLAS